MVWAPGMKNIMGRHFLTSALAIIWSLGVPFFFIKTVIKSHGGHLTQELKTTLTML